jgi:hypothetical protein
MKFLSSGGGGKFLAPDLNRLVDGAAVVRHVNFGAQVTGHKSVLSLSGAHSLDYLNWYGFQGNPDVTMTIDDVVIWTGDMAYVWNCYPLGKFSSNGVGESYQCKKSILIEWIHAANDTGGRVSYAARPIK